jgi:hypothetical protein
MKKISQELDNELLLYLDGELDSHAKESIELALQHNEALRQRLVQLQAVETSAKNLLLEAPSKNFTQMVMQRLDQYPTQASSFNMLNGILLLIGILLLSGIATILVSSGVFDQATGTLDLNTIPLPSLNIKRTLPSIPIDGKLIINVTILLNLGLCWLVFDRAVLKPLFRRRMQMGH